MNKKTVVLILSILIIILTFSMTYFMFDNINNEIKKANKIIYLKNIDLSKNNIIRWEINENEWDYNDGIAQLSIIFDNQKNYKIINKSQLLIKFNANAIVKDSKHEIEFTSDRKINNWYYNLSNPLSSDSGYWRSLSSNELEYGLGAINRYPYEKLIIEINIIKPDNNLNSFNPRLKLAPDFDHTIFEALFYSKVIKYLYVFFISVLLLLINVIIWRKVKKGT